MDVFNCYVFDDADLYINKLDKTDEEFKNIYIIFNHFRKTNKQLNVILCG